MVPVFKNVGEMFTAKNFCLVSILSVVGKVFEKLVNNRFIGHLVSNMVLVLFDQLQIFWQLYLVELLGFFIGLELLVL